MDKKVSQAPSLPSKNFEQKMILACMILLNFLNWKIKRFTDVCSSSWKVQMTLQTKQYDLQKQNLSALKLL